MKLLSEGLLLRDNEGFRRLEIDGIRPI